MESQRFPSFHLLFPPEEILDPLFHTLRSSFDVWKEIYDGKILMGTSDEVKLI